MKTVSGTICTCIAIILLSFWMGFFKQLKVTRDFSVSMTYYLMDHDNKFW